MLLKLTSSTKLIVVISVSIVLSIPQISASGTKGGSLTTSSSSSSASKLASPASVLAAAGSAKSTTSNNNKQFQLSNAFSVSSEPSVNYAGVTSSSSPSTSSTSSFGSFLDSLRSKSKLVLNEATANAIPTGGVGTGGLATGSLATGGLATGGIATRAYYGGSIYHIATDLRNDEALPEVNVDSSAENSSGEKTDSGTSSGEDFRAILGVETTSVTPTFEEDGVTTQRPVALALTSSSGSSSGSGSSRSSSSSSSQSGQFSQISQTAQKLQDLPTQEYEEAELINTRPQRPAQRIQAAVKTKHTFEYRPVMLDHLQEDIQPRIIEVAAKSVPLEIHFKSASSRIKLVQTHKSDELNDEVQRTSSDEEPQRLVHLVRKPIIQEVREIITPYRRIVQEIQPVMEEIHTIVSHEKERSKTSGGKQTTQIASPFQRQEQLKQQQASTQTTQSTQTSTQKKSQTQIQQKIEQQQIPTGWLRPVQNQISNQKVEQQQQIPTGWLRPVQSQQVNSNQQKVDEQQQQIPTGWLRPVTNQVNSNQQKVEEQQQQIPTGWLRPVQHQVNSNQQKIEQVRINGNKPIQQQKISSSSSSQTSSQLNSYAPSFNTFPLEVTSPAPSSPEPQDSSTENAESESEGIDDQSVEVINGNEISTIIPARLMQEILHDYQTRNRIMTIKNNAALAVEPTRKVNLPVISTQKMIQQHIQMLVRPQQPRPQVQLTQIQQQTQNQNQQNQNQQQQPQQPQQSQQQQTKGGPLRAAASNSHWQAVRPYMYYGAQNGQFHGPFPYQQQFHNSNNGFNRF